MTDVPVAPRGKEAIVVRPPPNARQPRPGRSASELSVKDRKKIQPNRMPKMWGEQEIQFRSMPGVKETLTRAQAMRAARAIRDGKKPGSDLLESLMTVCNGPRPPRWATKALESFTGGARGHGTRHVV